MSKVTSPEGGIGSDDLDELRLDDDISTDPDLLIGTFRRRSVIATSTFSSASQRNLGVSPTAQSPDSPLADAFSVRRTPKAPTLYDEEEGIELKEEKRERSFTDHKRNAGDGKYTVIAFLNSGSGGGVGKLILKDMQDLLGAGFVFDLRKCGKGNMPSDNLLPYAKDPLVRVLACGGDGTMGWILSSLDEVWKQVLGDDKPLEESIYKGHLPLAMMPLGTGNDLSRSFGWGPTFSNSMRKQGMIDRVVQAKATPLDRWRAVVVPFKSLSTDARKWVPAMLGEKMRSGRAESLRALQTIFTEGEEEEKEDHGVRDQGGSAAGAKVEDDSDAVSTRSASCSVVSGVDDAAPTAQSFDGVFCNYFSIGLDARVAFSFHKEREEHPERFTSATKNKIKYIQKGITEAGMFSFTTASLPKKLNGKVRVMVEDVDGELREIPMPAHCRGVALLNIQSYGGGNRFANGGSYNDGLIEVIFFTHPLGMATCAGMGPLFPFLRFKVRSRTSRVCIRIDEPYHCQVDGEPWMQSAGVFQISYFGRSPVLSNKHGCCK
ncbi:hypothetical protein TL16_g07210 [Triparma laevis f. inornata]|uniref:Diacylglycerol kinase n=2 Tax=Triparma laevis TaxID=1534972 RepID=A0A9W6Z8P2_9STRA|nr:hypothetical protein TrLO_g4703 [Triparma laevis f. longispina]GMH76827.1 hypothetical protein TL16_g07210 [Triparma laevis f. inornata]